LFIVFTYIIRAVINTAAPPRKNSERALKNSDAAYKSSEELYFLLLLEKKTTFVTAKHIIVAPIRKNIYVYHARRIK
jgi:hypothetical protein